jgi:ATP-dependent DNA helicase RecG
MATKDPCALLHRLIKEPAEREWLEFKVNNDNTEENGQYVSALANSAMLADRDRAYLVFGVENLTRKVVGTNIRISTMKGAGAEGLQNWLDRGPQREKEIL